MTLAVPSTRAEIGHTKTGQPTDIPLHHEGVGMPTVITGGPGVGKTHVLDVLARRIPAPLVVDTDIALLGDGEHVDVLLLDDADRLFRRDPQWWVSFLMRARRDGIAVVAAVESLALTSFGGSNQLRDLLLGGTVIRFWTPSRWDHLHESRVDLTALSRQGHGYVQQVDATEPTTFWLDQYQHIVGRWGALVGAFRGAPRALCGENLEANPLLPEPRPDSPHCPACLRRAPVRRHNTLGAPQS